jgi:hypothetical protein
LAQEFIRAYIWSYLLVGISSFVWQLLEVADHTIAGTLMSIAWGVTNIVIIGYLVIATSGATLIQIGYAYIRTAIFFIGLTLLIAHCRGQFAPFSKGLFGSIAICNLPAIACLLVQEIPLAFGSLLSNAEWAVLTVRLLVCLQ